MARWSLPPDLHREITGGPLCFFHAHSLGSRDGRVPRYSDSHACVRCIAALTEGRLSLDVHTIHRQHRRRFLEFWSLVDIGHPEECWGWQGAFHGRCGTPIFPIPRHWGSARQYSAQRVAVWYSWGDVGRLPIKPLCGESNCCNPLHVRVQGVPHYYHNRRLQVLDLEFNSRKLLQETQAFLVVTRQRDPGRYAKLEKTSKAWLEFRLNQDGPVAAARVAAALAAEDTPEDGGDPLDAAETG
jgi:hypothetical protein